ncbi:MAG: ABC transporter substrate-binding protein [Actinomycetes bacterium]
MTARNDLRRHPALLAAAATVTAALALSACSGTAKPSASASGSNGAAYQLTADTPKPKGDIDSFTWSVYAEPYSLDYAYAFDYPPNQILANVCESLLRWNADLSDSPGLASAYANPTPTTWVYTIRQGVTFHDGTPLTADDVVASLQRHLNPDVGSYWASVYQNVKSIVKTGSDQVTVTLTKPDSQFNQYMAASPGTIESAKTLTADGKDYGNPTKGVNCTGPFEFASWSPGQSITLKRYDGYWDPNLKAKAGQVKFVFLQDPNTRVNAWQSGEVDGGWQVPSNAYAQLKNGGPGKLYYGTNTTVNDEIVGNLKGVLGDKRVRQALLMAIDRKGIMKAGEQGVAADAQSLATTSDWVGVPSSTVDGYYGSLPQYPHDVTKAKALATAAGVKGQTVVIATSPITSAADVLTQAVAQAATDIGLTPKIETISPDKYTTLFSDPAARKGIDLFFTSWYVSIGDPLDMYGVLQTGQFSNYGGWSNPDYDAAVAAAIGTSDPVQRSASTAKAQQIAQDELPWLPLYTVPTTVWLGKRITGVQPSINFMYYPWAAQIGAAS